MQVLDIHAFLITKGDTRILTNHPDDLLLASRDNQQKIVALDTGALVLLLPKEPNLELATYMNSTWAYDTSNGVLSYTGIYADQWLSPIFNVTFDMASMSQYCLAGNAPTITATVVRDIVLSTDLYMHGCGAVARAIQEAAILAGKRYVNLSCDSGIPNVSAENMRSLVELSLTLPVRAGEIRWHSFYEETYFANLLPVSMSVNVEYPTPTYALVGHPARKNSDSFYMVAQHVDAATHYPSYIANTYTDHTGNKFTVPFLFTTSNQPKDYSDVLEPVANTASPVAPQ